MKTHEIRSLELYELETKMKNFQEELFNLRFQNASNQLQNNSLFKTLKKDIARIKTIITEKFSGYEKR